MKQKALIKLIFAFFIFWGIQFSASAAAGPSMGDGGHAITDPVKVILADEDTMTLLKTDWLNKERNVHFEKIEPKLSGLFWIFTGILVAAACFTVFLSVTGMFKRFSLNMKLYASYGSLVSLAVILGLGGYLYLERVNSAAHQETAFLDLDMMASQIQVLQNDFLLHGIENKAYGEKVVKKIKTIIEEYGEDLSVLKKQGHLSANQLEGITDIEQMVGNYTKSFETVADSYHEIEEAKELLDELGEKVDHTLEGMIHHHEEELEALEKVGADMLQIRNQTRLLSHLNEAEVLSLKLAHDEVEFMLDKRVDRVSSMTLNLGGLLGFLKIIETELVSETEKKQLGDVERKVEEYRNWLVKIIRDEAVIMKMASEANGYLHGIEHVGAGLSHNAELLADSMQKEGDIALMVLIIISIASGSLLSFFIARGISGPINQIINGMREGANQVASASSQVSSSSQSMAEGSSQQAASIEETSASMEEMSSMTQKNAENAGHADGLMKEANHIVGSANASMEKMTVSMEEISRASAETGKIIKNIDEIAFQTNLLALNAAVEAARAGEAGAGFAVVADEVRNLAIRAADAAKDTARLIESTVKKVRDGSELVASTNGAFDQVAESVEKVGGLVAEISEASKEQSSGIDQVNTAVSEMDKVVQANAANAEESAAAAEEMNAQAEQLRDYVGELVGLVSGKKRLDITGHKVVGDPERSASISMKPGPINSPEMLSRNGREVRREQIIALDEDKAFKDF